MHCTVCARDTIGVGVVRVGADTQQIVAGPLGDLLRVDFGGPLHTLVLAGDIHPMEQVCDTLY